MQNYRKCYTLAYSKMNLKIKKICYFGIYQPTAPRDKIYLEGIKKLGAEVILCVDNSPGLLKFFHLAKKLQAQKNQYDILWVGYLSTMVVPLAWLLCRIGLSQSDAVRGASEKRPNHTFQYREGAAERKNKEMRRLRKP